MHKLIYISSELLLIYIACEKYNLVWNFLYSRCYFAESNNRLTICFFVKHIIIRNKTYDGRSDIVCKHQRTFLSMNCVPIFIATSNNEHDWTPLKYPNVLHHNRIQKAFATLFS